MFVVSMVGWGILGAAILCALYKAGIPNLSMFSVGVGMIIVTKGISTFFRSSSVAERQRRAMESQTGSATSSDDFDSRERGWKQSGIVLMIVGLLIIALNVITFFVTERGQR